MFRFLSILFLFFLLQTWLEVHPVKAGFTLEQGIPHFNTKPYFLPSVTKNITALQGQSAYIHCRVAQLGDKKVSWIRGRDLHVLTSGRLTFASDERFLSIHQDRSENWTLHIRYSQKRDSGEYQCQINTQPKKSTSFYLNVVEATTEIGGSAHRYVKAGSSIHMSCKTSAASSQPGLVYWYRGSDVVTSNDLTYIKTVFGKDHVTSDLIIDKATEKDSGNYTCWPTKFQPDSVMVHVIPDEEPAAMSHGTITSNGGGGSSDSPSHSISIVNPPNGLMNGVYLYVLVQFYENYLKTFPLYDEIIHSSLR